MSRLVKRYVALLRAINVAGRNRLHMKELAALFREAGCDDVGTYIQSGNVVFAAAAGVARRVPGRVSSAIAERYGFEAPVVLRSAAALGRVARDNPFLARGADPATLHVAFLAARPAAGRVAALDPGRSPPDSFAVRGQEVYLWCPRGFARSKLGTGYLDAKLGTSSTVRNWRTVLALHEMTRG